MYLEKIRLCKNISELNKCIIDIFNESSIPQYVPALLTEGHYSLDGGEDFYAKLVAIPKSAKIESTWLRMNLVKSDILRSIDTKDISYNHNIVVEYPYLSTTLYAYNMALSSTDQIFFGKQEDVQIANQYYNTTKYTKKPMCLKCIENNYFVFSDLLKDLTNENYSDSLKICIDFEYRKKEPLEFGETGKITNELGSFDIVNSLDGGISIMGSIYFPLRFPEISKSDNRIKVIRIMEHNKIDSLDKTNYNDDTKVGIVLFNIEVIDILKEYYYLYDFTLISKTDNQDVLVDILDNKIGFFEGEFNKLPEDIVDKIVNYNITQCPKDGGIISPAMFDWQLNASWNFIDKALPCQKLGYIISSKYIEKAQDEHLNMFPPKSKDELMNVYKKIINLLNLPNESTKIENFINKLIDDGYSIMYCYQCICEHIYEKVK